MKISDPLATEGEWRGDYGRILALTLHKTDVIGFIDVDANESMWATFV